MFLFNYKIFYYVKCIYNKYKGSFFLENVHKSYGII